MWSARSGADLEQVQQIVKEYQDKSKNKVNLQTIPFGDTDTKLQAAMKEGTAPDLHDYLPQDWFLKYAEANLIAPGPTDLLSPQEKANMPDGWEKAHFVKGKLVGFPYAPAHVIFTRNKDLVPQAPETWESFFPAAKALNKGQQRGFTLSTHYWQLAGFWHGYGSYVFKELPEGGWDFNDVGWDNAGGLEAGKFLQRMAQEEVAQKDFEPVNIENLLKSKLTATGFSGQWAMAELAKSGIPIAVSPMPKLPNGEMMKPYLNYDGDTVPAGTKYPDEAWNLVKTICFGIQKFFLDDGRVPILKDLLDTPKAKESENVQGFLKQWPKYTVANPGGTRAALQWDPINNAIGLMLKGAPVDKTMKEAADQIRKKVKEAG
jgi:arabinogalactan oligomer/maltooligosaccharide transport system substrate-binding protein